MNGIPLKLVLLAVVSAVSAKLSILVPLKADLSEETDTIIKNVFKKTISFSDRVLYAWDHIDLHYLIANYSKLCYNPKINKYLEFKPKLMRYRKINVYFLSLTSAEIFVSLRKLQEWNSRAKFIIYYPNKDNAQKDIYLEEIFQELATYYIYNVVIITSNSKMYTYFPYKYENITNPHTQPVLIQDGNVFSHKLPKTWRNSSVIIRCATQPPFLYIQKNVKYDGSDVRLMENLIQPFFKFKTTYNIDLNGTGYYANGRYYWLLGRLFNHNADFAIGGVLIRRPRMLIDFDITFPVYLDAMIWAVPTPQIVASTWNLTNIFTFHAWFTVISSLFVGSILWVIFANVSPNEINYFKVSWNAATVPWKFLFCELSHNVPSSLQMKILFISTWLFVFNINAAWDARFIVTLTYTNREKPITTLQDIVDHNLVISIPSQVASMYNSTGGDVGKLVYKRNHPIETNEDIRETINQVSIKKTIATVMTRSILEFLLRKGEFLDSGGSPTIRTIDQLISQFNIAHLFFKGHPMQPAYNELLLRAMSSGFNVYFVDQYFYKLRLEYEVYERKRNTEKVQILTLEHLILAFGILGVGLLIASISFIAEKIYNYC